MYPNTFQLFDSANLVFVQKSQITLSPVLQPVSNIVFIHEQRFEILFEIFVAYFIDLNRELIEKRARVFNIDIFRADVIEVRHYFLIHVPEEVINIPSLFLVDRLTYTTSSPKKNSGNLARHKSGHIVSDDNERQLVTVYRPALGNSFWRDEMIEVNFYVYLFRGMPKAELFANSEFQEQSAALGC